MTTHAPTSRLGHGSRVFDHVGPEGNRIVAEILGEGPRTVVVLPGGGQERSRWAACASNLAARGIRVIVIDLRGHGDSERSPTGRYELEDYGRDVQAVLDQVGSPVTLAGHSMGGRVALLMTPGNPLVQGLVLIDSTPDMPADETTNSFLRTTTDGFGSVEEACERMEMHYGRTMSRASIADGLRQEADGRFHWHWDPAVLDRLMGDISSESDELCRAATRLGGIPALLVRTEFSQFVDDAAVARLRARVPQLEVLTLPGTHHHRPWASPQELAHILDTFSSQFSDTTVDNSGAAGTHSR